MKLRQAKKIFYSKHWNKRLQALRPSYYDEEREVWVSPSWHDIPIPTFQKARRRYFGAFKKFYNKHGYTYDKRR